MKMQYAVLEEQVVYFDLPHTPGLRIKGIMRGDPTRSVAVMMHGRPGSGNELLQYLGARYLAEKGIATLRLFMYDFEPNTRNLFDCTLQTNADDFDAVIVALRGRGASKIFGVGHSYGGLTILKSQAKLDAVVLWDPSHGSWWADHGHAKDAMYPEIQAGEFIIGTAGYGWVNSAAAIAYDKQLGDTSGWSAKPYPIMVISAGEGRLTDLGAQYIAAAHEPKRHVIIPDAHHSFDDSDAVMCQLFAETHEWLRRYDEVAHKA